MGMKVQRSMLIDDITLKYFLLVVKSNFGTVFKAESSNTSQVQKHLLTVHFSRPKPSARNLSTAAPSNNVLILKIRKTTLINSLQFFYSQMFGKRSAVCYQKFCSYFLQLQ